MEERVFVSGIVLAAGSSRRFGEDKLKQCLPSGRTVLGECLARLKSFCLFDELILVNNPQRVLNQAELPEGVQVIDGGATRGESALLGVKAADKRAKLVCIHDAARPLVSKALVKACIDTAKEFGACVPVLKMTDTVKKVKAGEVEMTLKREELFGVQTPQVFLRQSYLKACEALGAGLADLTDDSQIFERAGLRVKTVLGERSNIKITTKEDLILAGVLYTNQAKT